MLTGTTIMPLELNAEEAAWLCVALSKELQGYLTGVAKDRSPRQMAIVKRKADLHGRLADVVRRLQGNPAQAPPPFNGGTPCPTISVPRISTRP